MEMYDLDSRLTREFFDLTPTDLHALRRRIDRVRGHIRMSVHPYYIGREPDTFWIIGRQGRCGATEADRFLVSGFEATVKCVASNPVSSPLLIFEELSRIEETKGFVSELIGAPVRDLASYGILFCPTQEGAGSLDESIALAYEKSRFVPEELRYRHICTLRKMLSKELSALTSGPSVGMSHEQRILRMRLLRKKNRAYDRLIKGRMRKVIKAAVKTLPVRSVLLSGAYFYASTSQDRLQGCAGGIADRLRRQGILVDISRFTRHSRTWMKERRFVTKQTGKRK